VPVSSTFALLNELGFVEQVQKGSPFAPHVYYHKWNNRQAFSTSHPIPPGGAIDVYASVPSYI